MSITTLKQRVQHISILKHKNYLSLAMVVSLSDCLAATYNTSGIAVGAMFSEVSKELDLESSDVYFEVELL